MMPKIDKWVAAQNFTQDKFQSFVCWSLFIGALLALIPPTIVVVLESDHSGCIGTEFVVLGHYSTSSWLTEMFQEFKEHYSTTSGNKYCYQLIIADSAFDSDYTGKVSVWMPENYLWLDLANVVNNRITDCVNNTNTPLGLVSWTKFVQYLTNDGITEYSAIVTLADEGWETYTNGSILKLYPSMTGSNSFGYSHGHPNVTSSGILSLAAAISDLNNLSDTEELTSETISEIRSKGNGSSIFKLVSKLEFEIDESGPIDVNLIRTMMSHGPEFIQFTVGFENDVIMFNDKYQDYMSYLWNDTLQFIYLEQSFWMKNPLCVLTATIEDEDTLQIATDFMQFIDNVTYRHRLSEYGFRPDGMSQEELSKVTFFADDSYGVDNTINSTLTSAYSYPDNATIVQLQLLYQDVKKPVYLVILLDVSDDMSAEVNTTKNRFATIPLALDLIVNALEDSAIIQIQCFADTLITCYSSNETLLNSREDIIEYVESSLVYRKSNSNVEIFASLNTAFEELDVVRASNPEDYRYILLIITEDDTSESADDVTTLLETAGMSFDSTDVHVFPILYHGEEGGLTYSTLQTVAARTNGIFTTATYKNLVAEIKKLSYFF